LALLEMYGSTRGENNSNVTTGLLHDTSQQSQVGSTSLSGQQSFQAMPSQTISTQPLPQNMGWTYNAGDPMPSAPPFEAIQENFEPTEGAEVKPSTGDGCCGDSSSVHVGSIITSLVLLGGIAGSIFYASKDGIPAVCLVIFLVGYVIYLIECFVSKTMRYLRNIETPQDIKVHADLMRCAAPIFWWSIQCYHNVTELVYDAQQKSSRSQTRRVNTHFARGYFQYDTFMDKSLLLPNLQSYFVTRLDFKVNPVHGDVHTHNEYTRQMEYFKCVNIRDSHYDFRSGAELPGMRKQMLCEAEPGARPMFMSLKWFIIFSFLGLSLFYRFWMDSKTGKCVYYSKKKFIAVLKSFTRFLNLKSSMSML